MAEKPRAKAGRATTDPYADTHASDRPPPLSGTRQAQGEAPDPFVGRTLAHFRIDAPLGRGGMGAVYRGWDTALERPVAIKVLTIDHPQARERFLREARAQAKVRHPNVVPIHFVGVEGEAVFLSMDLIEGPSMADRLRAGPLDPDEALDVVDAVAQALEEGRGSGLVHRDVKPSNVLCAKDGRVLLADFGLAKAVAASEDDEPQDDPAPSRPSLTHRGAIVGTPAYMAPEQTLAGALDHRADMYALGVTLYEMVTGQLPFTAPNTAALLHQHREEEPMPPSTLNPALPPAIDALIHRLMRKEPEARFADYVALREAIEEARVRAAPGVGFFARGAAWMVDAIPSLFIAGLASELHSAVSMLPVILLWAFAEARWGKTLGKRLFAMRVVGAHERPPRFLRALWRNFLKHWALVAITALDAVPKSPIRDGIMVALFLAWAIGLVIAARRDKRALHDHLSRTRVAYDLR